MVIGNANGSNLLMLTPVLESGTWLPDNTAQTVAAQVDRSTRKILFEAEAHNSGKSYDIRLKLRPAPSKEKFWCGILAENELTIHLLRPGFASDRKFPVTVPFYSDWRSKEKVYGIPRIEYGTECRIRAAEHSIRLVYSQTKRTRTEVLATYSLAAPEETAKAIGLPPLTAIDPIEVWVRDGGDGLKIVVNPHSRQDLIALEAGLSREYGTRARTITMKTQLDLKSFTTIAPNQREIDRKRKELETLSQYWRGEKETADKQKRETDKSSAEGNEIVIKSVLDLVNEYETWLLKAGELIEALSKAELSRMHIFYRLTGGNGDPIVVDIVNIGADEGSLSAREGSSTRLE